MVWGVGFRRGRDVAGFVRRRSHGRYDRSRRRCERQLCAQGLSDGIIRARRISGFALAISGLSDGKVLRIDPATGDGYPAIPTMMRPIRVARSRVWALGCAIISDVAQTQYSSHFPGDGNPGVMYIGDVGGISGNL